MTKWALAIAVAVSAAAEVAIAQGARGLPPDSRLLGPATFKADDCVARIVLGKQPSFAVPFGETTIVIDKRYRMYIRPLAFAESGSYGIAFVPHDFLCDGKTHHVEVRWNEAKATTHQVTFPVWRSVGSRPATR